MIYKNKNLGSKEHPNYASYVLLENCDLLDLDRELVKATLEPGQWYNVANGFPTFESNIPDQHIQAVVDFLNKTAKYLQGCFFDKEWREQLYSASKTENKRLYFGWRKGVTDNDGVEMYDESEFDIPREDNEIIKPSKKKVAPQAEEKQEPMEQPGAFTGADPSKPVVPLVEPQEEPKDDTPLPSSMKALENMLGISGSFASPYDFSLRNIKPPSKPSVNSAMKAYCTATVLAIARALVARHYGKKFSKEQVKASLRRDFSTYANLKPALEILQKNSSLLTVGEMLKRCDDNIDNYIDGDVKVTANYMANYYGHPWSIEAFIRYQSRNYRISFKTREKMPHRSTKK